jgi:hypothetical protein
MLNTYINNNIRAFKPIRQEQIMHSDLEDIYNNRNNSHEEINNSTQKVSQNRLSKIYVRAESKAKHKRDTSMNRTVNRRDHSSPKNDYMPKSHDLGSTVTSFRHTQYNLNISKPIVRTKLRQEIWQLPELDSSKDSNKKNNLPVRIF